MPRGILSLPWTLPEAKLVDDVNHDTILNTILTFFNVDAMILRVSTLTRVRYTFECS